MRQRQGVRVGRTFSRCACDGFGIERPESPGVDSRCDDDGSTSCTRACTSASPYTTDKNRLANAGLRCNQPCSAHPTRTRRTQAAHTPHTCIAMHRKQSRAPRRQQRATSIATPRTHHLFGSVCRTRCWCRHWLCFHAAMHLTRDPLRGACDLPSRKSIALAGRRCRSACAGCPGAWI